MATVYLILALVIAIIAVVFALQNTATITISFIIWEVTGSLSLVLLVTLAIGVLIGLLFLSPSAIKSSLQASGQRKLIGALEKELAEVKTQAQKLADEKVKLLKAAEDAKAAEAARPTPPQPAPPTPPAAN